MVTVHVRDENCPQSLQGKGSPQHAMLSALSAVHEIPIFGVGAFDRHCRDVTGPRWRARRGSEKYQFQGEFLGSFSRLALVRGQLYPVHAT